MIHLDCTFRDGGYYNNWDFESGVRDEYLLAMAQCGVDFVEIGFRSLDNFGFKGAYAFSTDSFLDSIEFPASLRVGVMVNASELFDGRDLEVVLAELFPRCAKISKVELVRIACHVHEFNKALEAAAWLKSQGYMVGFNIMKIASCSKDQVVELAEAAAKHPVDVLYFADSLGGMTPESTEQVIGWLRCAWSGAIGVHTHDNMGLALSNTLHSLNMGASWVDSTVTGMGRGPGNAKTEELAIELADQRSVPSNLLPLMKVIASRFNPMKQVYNWGTNPFYYIAGKNNIHPTYVQQMLGDSRYSESDVLAVLDYLTETGGGSFATGTLDSAKHFYTKEAFGSWSPRSEIKGRDVLLLGTGPGVKAHKAAIEHFVNESSPIVIALNTQSDILPELIDFRIACHPVRLLADHAEHNRLAQPLITPLKSLPEELRKRLASKNVLDFGMTVEPGAFSFSETECRTPTSLVIAYALSVIASGRANRVLMAGFDGYAGLDPRNNEMNSLLKSYLQHEGCVPIVSITATRYEIDTQSVYGNI